VILLALTPPFDSFGSDRKELRRAPSGFMLIFKLHIIFPSLGIDMTAMKHAYDKY
jgi:hypothetical protein